MMSDYEKLTSLQRDFDKELLARDTAANPHPSLLGLSVNETMRECIVLGLPKRADQLRSKFSVPDKRHVLDLRLIERGLKGERPC
jgi:hypothetical protein